jgi:cellulose synthase/poly-beta-1,6-N-acetylglucosamine synthase-like glycosyltransferase
VIGTLFGTIVANAALVAYTYVGYPILVGACATLRGQRKPPNPPEGDEVPTISVLLPVYNGASALPAKLESLLNQDYPAGRLEVLIYCDGCSDDSQRVAEELARASADRARIRVVASPDRKGKPAALNALAAIAEGELLLMNDVRQPLSRNSARALAAEFRDPKVGCATGVLVLSGNAASGAYWRYEDWIRSMESRFRGVVGMTGAIAMMRRADFVPLPEDVILDDVWIPMRLVLLKKRVVSVREAEAYDAAFADSREFRRKVRTLAGNYQLFALLPDLLSPLKNPLWLEFVSHNVLRLAVPWSLAALLAASAGTMLGGGAATLVGGTLFGGQVIFYAAAAIGPRAGRLGTLARTFVVMNGAAALGLWRYATGRQQVTW